MRWFASRRAARRSEVMNCAMFTASPGEDPLAILARAQMYEDYIRSGVTSGRFLGACPKRS